MKPATQAVNTPVRPGSMKLWFSTKRPIFVVPERSKPMQERSYG